MFCMQSVKDIDGRGKLLAVSNHENNCGSCRKSEGTYRQKNLLDCVTLHITQKSRGSGNSSRQDFLETALECLAYFADKLADPPVLKVDSFFEESDLEAELDRSMKKHFFHDEGSSDIDFKVPSTSNLEISVWVNVCRDAMQNCRQIAATNTVILIDDQVNEASACSGKHAARDVTLTAKRNLEQGHLPIPEGSWSIVPCSRDFPGHVQSVFPKRQSHGQGT